MRKPVASAVLAVVLIASFVASAAASAEKVGPPNRITVLGDSISRGYNSQGSGCVIADCTANNWATGSNPAPNSYLRRLQVINPAAVSSAGGNGNHAVSGAKMTNLNTQALNAIATNPDLVLILMGANDVCASSVANMTAVTT